jgi:hypothetical protein
VKSREEQKYLFWREIPALRAGDGRLKLLWIEDLPDSLPLCSALLIEKWFSVILVKGPLELQQLYEDSHAEPVLSNQGLYAISKLPCDLILTDFRLCEHVDGNCDVKDHEELGVHAPSAGFLLGMLTALWYPNHPQCLIPWSAFEKEFGQVWKLTKPFCPETIYVRWDNRPTKSQSSLQKGNIFRQIIGDYRTALENSSLAGAIHLPTDEYIRLQELIQVNPERLPADECIIFVGDCGRRPILLGALFYDKLNEPDNSVPTSTVRDFLKKIAADDPLEREANQLAMSYWNLRWTEASLVRYEFSRYLAFCAGNPAGKQNWYLPELADVLHIDVEKAIATPDAFSPPADMIKPSIYSASSSHEITRRAVLYLCVRAEAFACDMGDGNRKDREFMPTIYEGARWVSIDRLRDVVHEDIYEEAIDELRKMPKATEISLNGSKWLVLPEDGWCSPDGVFKAIDPLPVELLTFEYKGMRAGQNTWSKDTTKITNALKRLGTISRNTGWGDMAIDIADVLTGRSFDELHPGIEDVEIKEGVKFAGAWDEIGSKAHFEGRIKTVGAIVHKDGKQYISLELLIGGTLVGIDEVHIGGQKLIKAGITSIEKAIAKAFNRPVRLRHAHGLRPGEGDILRRYAMDIEFDKKQWPMWLRYG